MAQFSQFSQHISAMVHFLPPFHTISATSEDLDPFSAELGRARGSRPPETWNEPSSSCMAGEAATGEGSVERDVRMGTYDISILIHHLHHIHYMHHIHIHYIHYMHYMHYVYIYMRIEREREREREMWLLHIPSYLITYTLSSKAIWCAVCGRWLVRGSLVQELLTFSWVERGVSG